MAGWMWALFVVLALSAALVVPIGVIPMIGWVKGPTRRRTLDGE